MVGWNGPKRNPALPELREIGHFGTGDLEITIASDDDLELAKSLLVKSYESS